MRESRTFAPLLFPGILKEAQHPPVGRVDELHSVGYPLERADFAPQIIAVGQPLYVRGWALWPAGPSIAGAVLAGVDDGARVEASYGNDRPDISASFGLASLCACGFDVRLPTGDLAPGSHELTVLVVDRSLNEYVVLTRQRFDVVNSRIRMAVDMPRASDMLVKIDEIRTASGSYALPLREPLRIARSGTLFVRGWAVDRSALGVTAGCAMLIDMAQPHPATSFLPRFDVAQDQSNPQMAYCGYEVSVDASALAPGLHTASIAAVSADGTSFFTAEETIPFIIE